MTQPISIGYLDGDRISDNEYIIEKRVENVEEGYSS